MHLPGTNWDDPDEEGKVSFSNTFDVEVSSDGSLEFLVMDIIYGAIEDFELVNQPIEW